MLTEDERRELSAQILPLLLNSGNGHQFLCTYVDLTIMGDISQLSDPNELMYQVIDKCERSGHSLDPPALAGLVDLLEEKGVPFSSTIRTKINHRPPRQSHPLDAEILVNSLPFADHTRFREIMHEMAVERTIRPVLVIQGGPYSGKSHCAELIDHYCYSVQGEYLFCRCVAPRRIPGMEEEAEEELSLIGPLDVANDLMSEVGGDPDDLPAIHTNRKKWYAELAQKVFAVANRTPLRTWFVIDGFEGPGLRDDTSDFLIALAQCFTSGITPRKHRLVFCGFGDSLHAMMRERLQTYRIAPLQESDLRSIVTRVLDGRGMSDIDRDSYIEQTMQRVIGDNPGPYRMLSEIGPRLRAVVEAGST